MRKAALTTFVIAIFIVYSYVIRHNHSAPVIAPATIGRNSSTSAPSTASSTQSQTQNAGSATTAPPVSSAQYKDGTYNGSVDSAFYGNNQVAAVISGGKITAVKVLQSPNENPNSVYVNSQALPYLKQETISAQSAHIDTVSGATLTSQAFIQSLSDALSQAK